MAAQLCSASYHHCQVYDFKILSRMGTESKRLVSIYCLFVSLMMYVYAHAMYASRAKCICVYSLDEIGVQKLMTLVQNYTANIEEESKDAIFSSGKSATATTAKRPGPMKGALYTN